MNKIRILFFSLLSLSLGCQNESKTNDLEEVSFLNTENEIDSKINNDEAKLISTEWREMIDSPFTENQLDLNSNICYNFREQNIYSDELMTTTLDVLEKGAQVELIELVSSSKEPINFDGDLVKVRTLDNQEGYLKDGYLLPIPLPSENTSDILEYALKNFIPVDSAYHSESKYGTEETYYETESYYDEYYFEANIDITVDGYYEGESTTGFFIMLSFEEALILLDEIAHDFELVKDLKKDFTERYEEFENVDWGYSSFSIKHNEDGGLNSIEYYYGDGCGEWLSVTKTDSGIEISKGGGC